ncbi:MAG TPA: hypothetical protein VEP91_09900 [Solirubrobacterales bacterium]|nr:hypothetical protein [Solirubrobacterales bacterium]
MNAPQASPEAETASSRDAIRGPEIGPALKRDRLLQRVRAARNKLSPGSGAFPRLR